MDRDLITLALYSLLIIVLLFFGSLLTVRLDRKIMQNWTQVDRRSYWIQMLSGEAIIIGSIVMIFSKKVDISIGFLVFGILWLVHALVFFKSNVAAFSSFNRYATNLPVIGGYARFAHVLQIIFAMLIILTTVFWLFHQR